jgi:hypothetical protein
MVFTFAARRAALEKEGVYIGGWNLRYFLTPRRLNGKHGESAPALNMAWKWLTASR